MGSRNQVLTVLSILVSVALAAGSPQYDPSNNPPNDGPLTTLDNSNPLATDQAKYRSAADTSSRRTAVIAHAACATGAFVILFPWGAVLLRCGRNPNIWLWHAFNQITAYLLYLVGSGFGLHLIYTAPQGPHTPTPAELALHAHPALGIAIFALMLPLPLLGWMHHRRYVELGKRTAWSAYHRWGARVLILAGMVNGGLGLRWVRQNRLFVPRDAWVIIYWSVAAVVGQVWLIAALRAFGIRKVRRRWEERREERGRRREEDGLWWEWEEGGA